MSKKLTGNGLFESSRMMLFEHRDEYNKMARTRERKTRPILDEQEWEQIGLILHRSQTNEEAVTITLFGEYEDTEIRGVVEAVGNVKIRVRGRWIEVMDIVGVGWD